MHDHSPGRDPIRDRRRLTVVLALVLTLLAVEFTVAVATGSLALLSDAGHLTTDVVGLAMALAAIQVALGRPAHGSRSFGWHRLEILAALANALLLIGLAVTVAVVTVRRWDVPHDLEAGPLLLVASIALVVNLTCARLLQSGAKTSLNIQGARLEVLADAAGSFGVLLTGAVIAVTGWTRIDSIVAVVIVAWLLPRALRLGTRSVRVLLQHAPSHLDVDQLRLELADLPGVRDVHDLHVWTLTSGKDVVTLHATVEHPERQHDTLHRLRGLIAARTGTDHVTVQIEPATDPACCDPHPADW